MRRRALVGALALALAVAGLAAGPMEPARAQAEEPCLQPQPLIDGSGNALVERLGLEKAWQLTRGEGVTVAVIDSGVDADNAHLQGAIAGGQTTYTVGPDQNPSVDPGADLYGHGTAAAGLIAARPIDGSDVVGVAPAAKILSLRAFQVASTEDQQNVGPSAASVANAIRIAADRGAQVINLSLSQATPSADIQGAVEYAQGRGALIVASAGNRGTSEEDAEGVRYPAALDGVLGVSAVTLAGEWDFGASFAGEHVDVVAPGQALLAPWCGGGDTGLGEQVSASWATAVVSGIAALVASAHPDESPEQWAHRIMATALRTTPDARKDTIGWGEARPYEAVAFVDDGGVPGPESPVHERPADVVIDRSEIRIEAPRDPLAGAREVVAWTLAGGVAVSLTALVIGRLGARRPIRRR
ncbi:S8 family serine peptidase [Microbacterium sp. Marseille-Q6965]|uniref:S8 family serine peptidase n=1 Tax=Microbacterium sp. Marseille-Q6965 TaxID=2965072 RepID=UPI0021B7382B|nr:S8 family serine peptidase [Microbacterium sp. Marseille-Q6965]